MKITIEIDTDGMTIPDLFELARNHAQSETMLQIIDVLEQRYDTVSNYADERGERAEEYYRLLMETDKPIVTVRDQQTAVSDQNPNKTYDLKFVQAFGDGESRTYWTCSCPSFRYQKGEDWEKSCKHIKRAEWNLRHRHGNYHEQSI